MCYPKWQRFGMMEHLEKNYIVILLLLLQLICYYDYVIYFVILKVMFMTYILGVIKVTQHLLFSRCSTQNRMQTF